MDDEFDALIVGTNPAMILVTTASAGQRAGCLVGFHSQSSIQPRHFTFWLSTANHTTEIARTATYFAVHFLLKQDRALAELFGGHTADDDIDKFEHCEWTPGLDGVPVLTACCERMIVEKLSMTETGGDHLCVVTRPIDVTSARTGARFHLSDATDIDAGHPPDE